MHNKLLKLNIGRMHSKRKYHTFISNIITNNFKINIFSDYFESADLYKIYLYKISYIIHTYLNILEQSILG